jgi:hypothetical protein
MKKLYILLFINLLPTTVFAQNSKNILFLGNSYTEVNNLPLLVKNIANSTGKTINYESNTPGGYTLQSHFGNNNSLGKITQGNWDFVVLQEQSQIPSFPDNYVNTNMFPYAKKLDSLINNNNPCAETVFYMTWGRKNGDASNCPTLPIVCTYIGMDDAIKSRYEMMANQNQAIVSPVGAVWRYIRNNYPAIELYSGDESHPSLEGSYAAACAFYTVIFRENPNNITYYPNIDPTAATQIRNATKEIVYNQLAQWNVGKYDLNSVFSFTSDSINPLKIQFDANYLYNGINYFWDFGDGQTSMLKNPIHIYTNPGIYPVKLSVSRCSENSTKIENITVNSLNTKEIQAEIFSFYPNPAKDKIYLKNSQNVNNYEILDASGRRIISNLIINNTIEINNLTIGNYQILFKNKNGKIIYKSKFIKE